MNVVELRNSYKKLNKSFKKVCVFHLGAEAGFFSEYNNMLLAILFCLKNKIEFKLYSADANFKLLEGWKDFFEPFCDEVLDSIHSKYNYRYPIPSFREIINSCKNNKLRLVKWYFKNKFRSLFIVPVLKRKYKIDLFTYEIFPKIRSDLFLKSEFYIPELGIKGNVQESCKILINLTWCFNIDIKREIKNRILRLNLPEHYVSLHIRGGDKFLESEIYSLRSYIDRLQKCSVEKNLFILTDDYNVIVEINQQFPSYNVFTFCGKNEHGYFHFDFCQKTLYEKKEQLLNLLTSIEIITNSKLFIGTFSSNPGMFVGCKSPSIMKGVDKEEWFVM